MALDIFDIKSAAVIGASPFKGKIGYEVANNMLKGGFKGKLFFVNPNEVEVLGIKCNRNIRAIEEGIDLAVICIKAEKVPQILKECVDKKIRTVIIISSGFSEIGKEGQKYEEKCKEIIRGSQTRIIGPNCIGLYDAYTGIDTTFISREKSTRPKKGSIAFISQSGSIFATILDWLQNENIGVSRFISYGNALDVNETELIEILSSDPNTKVITAYIENIRDGKKFIEAAKKVKKPIIVVHAGKSAIGINAVNSHTGRLASSAEVYSGAFKQAKIVEVSNWTELFYVAKAFDKQQKPKGKKLCIITNGGGFGVLASDEAEENGFEMPEPSKKMLGVLQKEFPVYVSIKNPIDLSADANPAKYRLAITEALTEYDIVLFVMLFQSPTLNEAIINVIDELNKSSKKTLICCSAGSSYSKEMIKQIENSGVPVFTTTKDAITALKAMTL